VKLSEAITKLGDIEIDFDKLESPNYELKKIDMSVCIESGIDCEFTDNERFYNSTISKLTKSNIIYWTEKNKKQCRPRMNHIHASPTGWDKCPIPKGFNIKIYWVTSQYMPLACEEFSTYYEMERSWSNIVMFEVTGIAEGWEL